ncbi:MAG: heavy metal translocating P-type ATPase, partial [Candidatus Neomarinimicrobiota bacterium]
IDTLVVDKTGTLTEGKPSVVTMRTRPGFEEQDMLALAAAVETQSEHPLGAAVVEKAREENLTLKPVTDFESLTGKGIRGLVDGREVVVGNFKWMQSMQLDWGDLTTAAEHLRSEGETVIYVAVDGEAAGIIGIADPVKATSREAIAALQTEGVKVVMLTGDNPTTAQAVARQVGIAEVQAEVLPEKKHEIVAEYQSRGQRVAMAGDGINDAPALAKADIGIAMGTGTDVAIESAGITLIKGDLTGIVRARRLSRAVMRNIRQNLFWAFIYNAVGVPVAAGVLYPFFGILLSPIIAAAAMSFSSVSVISNSLRLRRVTL